MRTRSKPAKPRNPRTGVDSMSNDQVVPDSAIEAAKPFVDSFMERRGFAVKGKEAEVLIGYILNAAAPHLSEASA